MKHKISPPLEQAFNDFVTEACLKAVGKERKKIVKIIEKDLQGRIGGELIFAVEGLLLSLKD